MMMMMIQGFRRRNCTKKTFERRGMCLDHSIFLSPNIELIYKKSIEKFSHPEYMLAEFTCEGRLV